MLIPLRMLSRLSAPRQQTPCVYEYCACIRSGHKGKFRNRVRKLMLLPKQIVHAAGALAGMWNRFTHQTFPFNKANAYLLTLDNYYSNEKARIELDLKTTPVPDAIEQALA